MEYQPAGLHQADAKTRARLAFEQRSLAAALDRTMTAPPADDAEGGLVSGPATSGEPGQALSA